MLAANIWHWWIGVALVLVAVISVVARRRSSVPEVRRRAVPEQAHSSAPTTRPQEPSTEALQLNDAADSVAQLLARCTFPPPGTAVTCASPAGADSTALVALAVAAGLRRHRRPRRPRPAAGSASARPTSPRRSPRGSASPFRAVRRRRRCRPQPRGAGPGRPPRRARPPARSPGTPPTTRPRRCCSTCCAARARRAWRRSGPGRRHPLLAAAPQRDRRRCAHALGLVVVDDRVERRPALPCATGSATRCSRCSTTSPGATSSPCSPARPTCSATTTTLLDELGAAHRPDRRRARSSPQPLPGSPAVRCAGGSTARAATRPTGRRVERVLAVARGEAAACELAGGGASNGTPAAASRHRRQQRRGSLVTRHALSRDPSRSRTADAAPSSRQVGARHHPAQLHVDPQGQAGDLRAARRRTATTTAGSAARRRSSGSARTASAASSRSSRRRTTCTTTTSCSSRTGTARSTASTTRAVAEGALPRAPTSCSSTAPR